MCCLISNCKSMKKNRMGICSDSRNFIRNCLLKMRFLFLFLVCVLFQAQASVYSQQVKVTVKMDNVPLEELFEELGRKTNLDFLYNVQVIRSKGNVSVEVSEKRLQDLLTDLLAGLNLEFITKDNVIVIRESEDHPSAQNRATVTLKGRVSDSRGMPLPGVTVLLKGTTLGGATDRNGEFQLTIPEQQEIVLLFSFIGMKSKEFRYTGQSDIRIVLEELLEEMDEVVVTGIFQRKAESFTGSTATYKTDDLQRMGSQNVLQSLNILDPAFNITPNNMYGSDPNRLPDIDIRGKTSIEDPRVTYATDPNQPLFILDGFQVSLQEVVNLDMNRVASVTLLKDAASTAIYGAQAANGVVVIETVKPEPGRLQVTYGGSLNLSMPDLTDYNLMNAKEKLEFERLAGLYNASNAAQSYSYMQLYNLRLQRVESGVDSYWLSEPLHVGTTNKHNIFISGGDHTVTYGLGFNYGNTQGAMKKSGNDVIGLSLDLQYRLEKIRFNNKFSLNYSKYWDPPVNFDIYAQTNPYFEKEYEGDTPRYLENFLVGEGSGAYYLTEPNPNYNASLNYLNDRHITSFRDNFYVEWRPLEGFQAVARFSIEKSMQKSILFKSPYHTDFKDVNRTERGSYTKRTSETMAYSGDLTFTFYKLIADKHQLNLAGTLNYSSRKTQDDAFTATGFADDIIPSPAFANQYALNSTPSYGESESRSANMFLNGGFVWDSRYAVDFTLRRDGSTNFGKKNLFTLTWSAGLAWNLHNEDFIGSWADLFKIRCSAGNPGNNNVQYATETTYRYTVGYQNMYGNGLFVNQFGNPYLDWQKVLDLNAGMDVTLFNRRLSLSMDFFTRKADPLIVTLDVPSSTGRTTMDANLGKNTVDGMNFKVDFKVINRVREKIVWSIGMNGSTEKSKFSGMGNLDDLNNAIRDQLKDQLAENAKDDIKIDVNSLKRYKDGYSQYDIWAVRSGGIDPSTGNEVYIRKDGSYTFTYNVDDEVKVGNSNPTLRGRINSSLRYKGFTVDVALNYIFGEDVMNMELFKRVEGITSNGALTQNQDKRALYDRWSKPGDVAKFRRIGDFSGTSRLSDRYLQRKNWLSMDALTLGYEFSDHEWLKRSMIQRLTVRMILSDIFHCSTIKQERGINYPFDRKVAFTLNLTF